MGSPMDEKREELDDMRLEEIAGLRDRVADLEREVAGLRGAKADPGEQTATDREGPHWGESRWWSKTDDAGRVAFLKKFFELTSAHDLCAGFHWRAGDSMFPYPTIYADCSDVFDWGSSDSEEVTPDNIGELERACLDVEAACPRGSFIHGVELFCARVRKCRPQGACYEGWPRAIADLFDACGPERPVGLGNPRPNSIERRERPPQAPPRVKELEDAIRRHRDQRGDDRCWLDDEELYKALPEGHVPPARDCRVELSLCEKYIASRHNPGTEYVSPQRRIEELEAEIEELKK